MIPEQSSLVRVGVQPGDNLKQRTIWSGALSAVFHLMLVDPARAILILGMLTLSSLTEGLGIAALLPILNVVSGAKGESDGISKFVVDGIHSVGLKPEIGILISILVALALTKALLTLLSRRAIGNQVASIASRFRVELIEALLRSRWQYFTRQPLGSVANVMTFETNRAASIFGSGCDFLTSVLFLLVYGGLAFTLSWEVTLSAACFGVLMFLLLHGLLRMARKAGQNQTRAGQELLSRLNDVLNSIKPLKAMAREHQAARTLSDEARDLETSVKKQIFSSAALTSAQEAMITAVSAAALYVAVKTTTVTLPQLILMVLLFQRILSRVGQLQSNIQKVATHEIALLTVEDMIVRARAEAERKGGDEAPVLRNTVQLTDVHLSLDGRAVLNGATMKVPARSLSVLVGPSGAGKTTIIDVIVGLHQPDRGEALVDGNSIAGLDPVSWRERIGYVPQETILFNDTIMNNVALHDERFSRESVQQALRDAGLAVLSSDDEEGLDRMVGERGMQLSGGQRQRIAIARALVRNPDLLILDEATANLDPNSELELCDLISDLSRNVTVLAVSHRDALVKVADRIYTVKDGRVLENAAH